MSEFSAAWLALREPHDLRARNRDVLAAVDKAVASRAAVGIVDLACGTGAMLRALSPHLAPRQDWRLVDNDLSLLARARSAAPPPRTTVTAVPVDLVHDLEAALDGPVDLVTTSALLDLVSERWLDRLVTEAAARRLPVYATLSYDGRVVLEPGDPLDGAIVAAVNRHQRTDKGFGPALGPDAARAAVEKFRAIGYSVVQGPSDWALAPDDREIQAEILAGWAVAATEIATVAPDDAATWLERRRRRLAAEGRSRIVVGHVDFFAYPDTAR